MGGLLSRLAARVEDDGGLVLGGTGLPSSDCCSELLAFGVPADVLGHTLATGCSHGLAGRMMLGAASVQRSRSHAAPAFEWPAAIGTVALPADDWDDPAIVARVQVRSDRDIALALVHQHGFRKRQYTEIDLANDTREAGFNAPFAATTNSIGQVRRAGTIVV
jgi:hypothetical protein